MSMDNDFPYGHLPYPYITLWFNQYPKQYCWAEDHEIRK